MSPSHFHTPIVHVMSGEVMKNGQFIRQYLETHNIIVAKFIGVPEPHDIVWYVSANDVSALGLLKTSGLMLHDKPAILAVAEGDIKKARTLESALTTSGNTPFKYVIMMVPDKRDSTGEIVTYSWITINRLLLATFTILLAAFRQSLKPSDLTDRQNMETMAKRIIDETEKAMQDVEINTNATSSPPQPCGAMLSQIANAYHLYLSAEEINEIWKMVYVPATIQRLKLNNPKYDLIQDTFAGTDPQPLPMNTLTMAALTRIIGELVLWICDVITSLGATTFADVGAEWFSSLTNYAFNS